MRFFTVIFFILLALFTGLSISSCSKGGGSSSSSGSGDITVNTKPGVLTPSTNDGPKITYIYVVNRTGNAVNKCLVEANGALTGCSPTGSGFVDPISFVINNNFAFISNYSKKMISVCSIDETTAELTKCKMISENPTTFDNTTGVALNNNFLYVGNFTGGVFRCNFSTTDLSLKNCINDPILQSKTSTFDIKIQNNFLYVVNKDGLNKCSISNDGSLNNCTIIKDSTFPNPVSLVFNNNYVYIANGVDNGKVALCSVNSDGTFDKCVQTLATNSFPRFASIANGTIYLTSWSNRITSCQIDSKNGDLNNCTSITAPIFGAWQEGIASVQISSAGSAANN